MQKSFRHTKSRRPTRLLWVLGSVALVLVIFAALEFSGVTHIFHKRNTSAVSRIIGAPDTAGGGTQNNQKGEAAATTTPTATSENTTQPGDSKSGIGGSATVLLTPTGDFVSNHHPNLSGAPAPNTITSVCNTTPGATCVISFTKDGSTKSLPVQTTDRNGSAFWNSWSLAGLGLTAGSWQIQATAVLGSQTKTATDTMPLEVSP